MTLFTITSLRATLPRLGVLALLGFAAGRAQAQAPTWASVQRTASTGIDSGALGSNIAVAADGSQYVTGTFDGILTLGSITLTPGAGDGHLFLAKYSAAGAVLWATKLDAATGDLGTNVAVDAAGNAYLTGFFDTFLTLGTTTLTSPDLDGFLVKYDAQGVQQWVRQGGSEGIFPSGIATDASGNVTVVGGFDTVVSFGGTALSGGGVFLYRFSPTGSVLLAKKVSDTGYSNDVALDGAGNAYVTGEFSSNATFGTSTLTSAGGSDIFLCKVGPTGTSLWAQRAGGSDGDAGVSVAVDAGGNPVVGGRYDAAFTPTTDFSRFYVARFSTLGVPQWTRLTTPTVGADYQIEKVAYDNRGGYYVTGGFEGTVIFGGTSLTGIGETTLLMVRYDSQGNAVWAGQAVNSDANSAAIGFGLATDATGNVFVTGAITGSVQFGALPVSMGGLGTLVAKITAGAVLTATRPTAAGIALEAYPNPATGGSTTLVLPAGGGRLVLLDALGRSVREQALPTAAGPCPVALTGLAPGFYQLRATLGNGQLATAPLQVR
jgi:hypothetical protein